MTNYSNDYVFLVHCVSMIGFALIFAVAILGLVRKYGGGKAMKILFIVLFFSLYLLYKVLLEPKRCSCGHLHPCCCSCKECQNMFLIYMD